jgi:hypothetical protein
MSQEVPTPAKRPAFASRFRRPRREHRSTIGKRRLTTTLTLTALLALGAMPPASPVARAAVEDFDTSVEVTEIENHGYDGHVRYLDASGNIVCRGATPDESVSMKRRGPNGPLHVIKPARKARGSVGGLNIVLRATPQLENFPAAKAAYIRAAETLEALIGNQITVVIDVDFGPTRFGEPYDPNIIGSTDPQFHQTNPNLVSLFTYSATRARLVANAGSAEESGVVNQLPSSPLPTDRGNVTSLALATSVQRALGFIGPAADPNANYQPSIGFNSILPYDFDPTNGIDANKFDFNGTALHEFGHALGFNSWVGLQQLDPGAPNLATTWDLFRFRPGVSLATFGTAQRILSSGGEHVFFNGTLNTRLATGRLDGSGGDGNQGSHWKDNSQNNGVYIGVMDPIGEPGFMDRITAFDLAALNFMGFQVGIGPKISALASRLTGNTLEITGTATAGIDALSQATIELLDAGGAVVGTLNAASIDVLKAPAAAVEFDFVVTFTGLEAFPTATQSRLTLVDADENTSEAVASGFGAGDTGAPQITAASYKTAKSKIALTGNGFSTQVQLEINGVVVAPPLAVKSKNARKLNVKATVAQLNLNAGPNRVRVLSGNLQSNIFVMTR